MHDPQAPQPKRPYAKPTITRIELHAEQQVVASCKTTRGGGKNMTFPNPCIISQFIPRFQCKTSRGS